MKVCYRQHGYLVNVGFIYSSNITTSISFNTLTFAEWFTARPPSTGPTHTDSIAHQHVATDTRVGCLGAHCGSGKLHPAIFNIIKLLTLNRCADNVASWNSLINSLIIITVVPVLVIK